MALPIPGIEHVISSNEAFHLPELPRRILIQGGGYIALEFACIFAGFGSDVTVVYRGDNILRGFDEDVRTHVRGEMEKRGDHDPDRLHRHQSVDKHGKDYTSHLSNGSSIASEQVMFAIGRHPNVAKLGLEKAGVAINPKNGGIAVDGWSKTLGAEHLCDRRRHPSPQPDAGRDPRGPRLCRHRVRQAAGAGRSCHHSDRGVLAARSRHGRTDRSGSPRAVQPCRHLQGDVPADQGDHVGPRHPRADEACSSTA